MNSFKPVTGQVTGLKQKLNDAPETHLITGPNPSQPNFNRNPELSFNSSKKSLSLHKFACSKCIKLSVEHKQNIHICEFLKREKKRQTKKRKSERENGRFV